MNLIHNNNVHSNIAIKSNQKKNIFKIYISGMTCSHCVESVKKSLLNLKEVKEVQVNLESGEVLVVGRNLNNKEIEKNIKSLGYTINEK